MSLRQIRILIRQRNGTERQTEWKVRYTEERPDIQGRRLNKKKERHFFHFGLSCSHSNACYSIVQAGHERHKCYISQTNSCGWFLFTPTANSAHGGRWIATRARSVYTVCEIQLFGLLPWTFRRRYAPRQILESLLSYRFLSSYVSGPPQHCHEIEFHSYHALVSLPQWRHSFSLVLTLKFPVTKHEPEILA